jgi:hypothetical protein
VPKELLIASEGGKAIVTKGVVLGAVIVSRIRRIRSPMKMGPNPKISLQGAKK